MVKKNWFLLSVGSLLWWSGSASAGLAPANFEAMFDFASQGKVAVLTSAVNRGMDIDSLNETGDTGLCSAIVRYDFKAYNSFRLLGANPEHRCVSRISKDKYMDFMEKMRQQRAAEIAAAKNPAQKALPQKSYYGSNYGDYVPSEAYQNRYGYVSYNPEEESWISSETAWTLGAVALVGAGIAVAVAGGGGDDGPEDPEANILASLHGVGGSPYQVNGNIDKNVVEAPGAVTNAYWGVYAPDNKDIINKETITINNITASATDSKDHWGGIFSKNGFVYNAGDIILNSTQKYGKGIMSCIVSVYNPNNTACVVDPAHPIVGDVYNAGNITINANQSMGVFTSTINKITNTGTIKMTGDDNAGIFIFGNGNVENSGNIILSGANTADLAGAMHGIWIAEEGNVTNNGNINIKSTTKTKGGTGIYTKKGIVTNNGRISLDGGGYGVRTNEGTLVNNGTIEMVNGDRRNSYAMRVDQSGNAENNGSIKINGNGNGIYIKSGDVVNRGTIEISGNGIAIASKSGNVTNAKGAVIDTQNGGISAVGDVINDGTVSTVTGTAISSDGMVTNNGDVVSTNGAGISGGMVVNNADVIAKFTGITAETSGENNGRISGSLIGMLGGNTSLTNNGSITSKALGMFSIDDVTNNKTILITGSGAPELTLDHSMALSTSKGTATNTGTITMKGQDSYGMYAITDSSAATVGDSAAVATFVNSGTIILENGGYAMYSEVGPTDTVTDPGNSLKFDSLLTATNSGKMVINNSTGTVASGMYATENGTLTNDGRIEINNTNNTVGSIYGMRTSNGGLTNNKDIVINAFDTHNTGNEAAGAKSIIGMYIETGTATNNGNIIINGNNAIGMKVVYTPLAGADPADTKIYASVVNNGLIQMSGENNIGLYASGKGAAITNSGTVEIKKANETDIHRQEGDTIYNSGGTNQNSFIWLENGAVYVNTGTTTSDVTMNFADFGNGAIILGKGGKFEAPEISGKVYANSDIVKGSFEEEYRNENSFVGGDGGINVVSNSYLFDAKLQKNEEGGQDVVMNRKSFKETLDNSSAANFLEKNYFEENNLGLFDELKTAGSRVRLGAIASQEMGLNFFPNFAKQNLDMLKSLNQSMNNTILSNSDTKEERASIGYDYMHRKQDGTSDFVGYKDDVSSVYGLFDKKSDNGWRYGWGGSFSTFSSDYDNGFSRDEKIIQLFAPFLYESDESQFITTPRIGYGWGDYTRYVGGDSFSADIADYSYGVTNELRHEVDLGLLVLEPIMEFNVLGLYQGSMDEGNKLDIESNNNLSVEGGLGLYVKKIFGLDNGDEVRLRAGGTMYHEFNNPYARMNASINGMSGDYTLNHYQTQRNRAVLSTRAEYQHQQMNFYGQLNKYIEDDSGYEANAGLDYRF